MDSDVGDLLDPEGMSEQPMTLFEDRALHTDDSFTTALSLCRQAVLSRQGVHHLAYYVNGVYGFAVDMLDDPTAHLDRPADSIESKRSDYERIGCQLSNTAKDLDGTLQELRSGALIRTVLHAPRGMVCCNSIVPNEYIVGLTFDVSSRPMPGISLTELAGAKKLDIAIARLATVLRQQLSLQSLNPGGWVSPKPVSDETSSSQQPRLATVANVSAHIEGAEDDDVADLFLAEVDPADLHYLASCRDGEVIFSADQLGHRQLSRFFTQITVEKRRSFYRDFCRQLPVIIGKFGRMVGSAIGGRLERVVLDVEQGAIYYYRVRTGEYLVGATIDQAQVAHADNKIARLTLRCQQR